MNRPLYFDCDTGIDDALALAYLLASPEIDLVGIGSVSGNIDAERGAVNTLDLLALAGRPEVPVAVGAHDPLVGQYEGGVPHIHGHNGVGNVELPVSALEVTDETAPEMLVRLSHEYPGELEVVAVGPLTNLALALALDPTIVERVKIVTIMGGAARVPGNITPAAEANIYNDADAAAIVVRAPWPVVLVPLDITIEHTFEESDRSALLAGRAPSRGHSGRSSTCTSASTSSSTVAAAAPCTIRSPPRSPSAASSPRTPPRWRSWSTTRAALVAARPSATCATSATGSATSPGRTCGWCSRPTPGSPPTCSRGY